MSLNWNGVEIELGAFSEAMHPRVPAGGAGGGEFGSKSAAGASKGKTAPKGKPGPNKPAGNARVQAMKQIRALRSKATADRAKAAEIEARIGAIHQQIHAARTASAKASAASKKAAATTKAAAAAGKAATKATVKTTAKKSTVKKKTVNILHLQARVSSLRGQVKSLRASANALDIQARSIPLANDHDDAIELAFREILAERVPPGRPEGGQFSVRAPHLTRYDTAAQRAAVINSLDGRQRAGCRASWTLPPPGFEWRDHDRLAERESAT